MELVLLGEITGFDYIGHPVQSPNYFKNFKFVSLLRLYNIRKLNVYFLTRIFELIIISPQLYVLTMSWYMHMTYFPRYAGP